MPSLTMPAEAPRVVVVEDDEALALVLRYNLEFSGFDVEVVSSGVEALRQIVADPPRLAILDWNVPRLSGIEVLRHLRRQLVTRLPVVMLTARTSAEDRTRALALGVDAYIEKPFAIRELMAVVDRFVGREGEGQHGLHVNADRHHGCMRAR